MRAFTEAVICLAVISALWVLLRVAIAIAAGWLAGMIVLAIANVPVVAWACGAFIAFRVFVATRLLKRGIN